MLFRKLELNWRYAASELAIVVLGVLLALWAQSWREQRQERSMELEIIQALIEDLRVDTASISSLAEATRDRVAYARLVLTAFDTGERPTDPIEFARAVEYGNYFSYPNYTTATIDDLTSTGRLRLIRSSQVKDAIADYYAEIEWTGQFEGLQRTTQGELGLLTAEFLDLDDRYSLLLEGVGRQCGARGFSCEGAIPWAREQLRVSDSEADEILERLLRRPEARTLYAAMARFQGQHHYNLTSIHHLATIALGVLETYASEW